jgi:hypothetical protein
MSKIGRSYFALIAEGHTPANTGGLVDLTPSFKVQKSELISALNIAPVTGVAGKLVVTIAGTYAVGDLVRITITSNLTGRQLYRKTFVHTVVSGGTSVTAIATALANKIAAEVGSNSPFASATNAAGVITITQVGDDKVGLVGYVYTDSAAGTIANVPTTTTISEGQPSDLVDRGIDSSEINLAAYDTVRIDLHAENAIPFIDAEGAVAKEIYWFGTPGEGSTLATLINS